MDALRWNSFEFAPRENPFDPFPTKIYGSRRICRCVMLESGTLADLVWADSCHYVELPHKAKKKADALTRVCLWNFWCPGRDSNPHASRRYPLKIVRLPIPPPGQGSEIVAGKFKFVNASPTLCTLPTLPTLPAPPTLRAPPIRRSCADRVARRRSLRARRKIGQDSTVSRIQAASRCGERAADSDDTCGALKPRGSL